MNFQFWVNYLFKAEVGTIYDILFIMHSPLAFPKKLSSKIFAFFSKSNAFPQKTFVALHEALHVLTKLAFPF